jgi:hypothetical protein
MEIRESRCSGRFASLHRIDNGYAGSGNLVVSGLTCSWTPASTQLDGGRSTGGCTDNGAAVFESSTWLSSPSASVNVSCKWLVMSRKARALACTLPFACGCRDAAAPSPICPNETIMSAKRGFISRMGLSTAVQGSDNTRRVFFQRIPRTVTSFAFKIFTHNAANALKPL